MGIYRLVKERYEREARETERKMRKSGLGSSERRNYDVTHLESPAHWPLVI